MSFRIEDILRKDSLKNRNEKIHAKRENVEKSSPNINTFSILQQTLLNKVNPHQIQVNDYYSNDRLYSSSVYSCEKGFLSHTYPDIYIGNAHPFHLPLYPRNRYYAAYESIPMMYQVTSKRKGGQVRFTSLQTDALEKRFVSHKYLSPEDRRILAESLKLTDKQVKTWFQNRRAKWRRCNSISSSNTDTDCEKQIESDSERLFCDKLP